MSTIKVTDADFQDTLQNNNLVLVDFWAPWCGPCRAVAPVLEEIASENSNVVIAKMNTDENPNTASQHGIMSIPTMMIFKNGELVDRLVGALPKPAIMEKLQPHFYFPAKGLLDQRTNAIIPIPNPVNPATMAAFFIVQKPLSSFKVTTPF